MVRGKPGRPTGLSKPPRIRRRTAPDDEDDIDGGRQLLRRLVAPPGLRTGRIDDPDLRDLPSESAGDRLRELGEPGRRLRRLGDDGEALLPCRYLNIRRLRSHPLSTRPGEDPFHLWMRGLTVEDDEKPLLDEPRRPLLGVTDDRACRIHESESSPGDLSVDLLPRPVRGDRHRTVRWDRVDPVDEARTARGKIGDDMGVVNNRTEGIEGAVLVELGLDHPDRPPYPAAETEDIRFDDAHPPPPRERRYRPRAITGKTSRYRW